MDQKLPKMVSSSAGGLFGTHDNVDGLLLVLTVPTTVGPSAVDASMICRQTCQHSQDESVCVQGWCSRNRKQTCHQSQYEFVLACVVLQKGVNLLGKGTDQRRYQHISCTGGVKKL